MPKLFKPVAIAGIVLHTISLAVLYPLVIFDYFYDLFEEDGAASAYTIFDKIDWVIGIPLSFVLLIVSVGLLYRKEWGRKGCVVGLAISIGWNFTWLFLSLAFSSGDGLGDTLIVAPIVLLLVAFEVLVLFYLNGANVKGYMRAADG